MTYRSIGFNYKLKNAHTKPQSHQVTEYNSFVSLCLRVRIIKRTFLYDKKQQNLFLFLFLFFQN